MPRPKQLSARALTIGLVTTSIATFAILTFCIVKFGRPRDTLLPVEVACGKFPVPVPSGGVAVLTEAVKLRNLSDSPIPHLKLQLNKRFFYDYEKPLAAGDELVIPLEEFKTKAVQPFRPDDGKVTIVTVFGQLPNRSRGVVDFLP